jgi:phage-related protein
MAYDLGTARGTIELEYEGRKAADAASSDMDRVSRSSKSADKDVSKLGKTFRGFLGAGKAGGVASMAVGITNAGVAAASLGIQLAGVVPQLASIGSLAAGLPALFTAGAAAMGVMQAATAGMEEAITAAFDPEGAEKFQEALKQLSPAAQEVAVSIRDSVPALKEVQKGIQEAFFGSSGLAEGVPVIASALQGLRPQLQGMAGDFGRLAQEAINFAVHARSMEFIRASIDNFRAGLAEATPALQPLLAGLRDVGTVGSELLERLGGAIGTVGTRFGEWLSEIANNGQLQAWIDEAISTLGQLGGIASNVGSILNSVFQTAEATGGGLLGILEQATGSMASFLNSAQGSEALTTLFSGIMAVARQLAPVFTTLAGALAGALGPALAKLATEVGPVLLQVVQALAPAFGPLADAVASLIGAVAPLLAPIGKVVSILAQLASGVIQSLVQAFGPLIEIVAGALMEAFTTLEPVITQLVSTVLPMAAEMGTQLAEAFAPLVPSIVELAQAIADGLVEYFPVMLELFKEVMPLAVQLAETFATLLGPAISLVADLIGPLVDVFSTVVEILTPVIGVIVDVATAVLEFVAGLVNVPGEVGSIFSNIGNTISTAFSSAVDFIGNAITNIVNFFTQLPGRLMSAIQALPGQVWNLIKNMATQAAFLFGQMIGLLVTAAVTLPPRILAAIRALPGQLANLIRNAWNTARNLFLQGVAAAVGIARALPGRVRSAISSLLSAIRTIAVNAWNALRNAFVTGIARAVTLAREMPGRIRSAIGNLGSLLLQAGRDAVAGLVNGIRSGVGAVGDAARSLGSSIMEGIRSTLKIGSPSKVMIQYGQWVNDGLVKGMLGTASQVQAAANKVADIIAKAFSEKLISKNKRDSLTKLLKERTSQMLALVKQSENISARLKAAQDKLVAAQKNYSDAFNSAADKTRQSFSLVSTGQNGFVDLNFSKKQFQAAVAQARKFATDIATLAKRGLNKDLLQQLVDAGADQGGAMAAALAGADAATFKEFNVLQTQLNKAADAVGKTTADTMYGAGLKAAQGLVAGLAAQEKAIQKQMTRIANQLAAAIKKALKIKSPSRVMFNLGKFTTQGLIEGLESLRRRVEQAASDLATTSIIPTVRLGVQTSATTAGGAVGGNTGALSSTTNVFNQTVNALPGMDSKQVADYSFTRLNLASMSGVTGISTFTPAPKGA